MTSLLCKIRDRMVENWCHALRWLSVQWALLGTIIMPILTIVPSMPHEFQALLPPPVRAIAAAVWCLLFIVFRLYAQKKPNG